MNNLYSIGEVSKIKGITVKALRYYHKMGILVPRYIDESTGYRYYSIDQFVYIDIIKGCRELGTSIAELKEIFRDCNTEKLVEFMQKKKIQAEENIEKMKKIIKNVDTLSDTVKYSQNSVQNDDIITRYIKKRYVVVAPCTEAGSLKELLYYSRLEKIIKKQKIKISAERGIIYSFDEEGKINPKYVFSGLDEKNIRKNEDNIIIVEGGKYLILSYSRENEEERIEKIIDYVKKNNLKVKNFIEIELLNDVFNIESYSCEIQLLIEEN